MGTITSANAVFMIQILPVYTVPVQLQGWAADDAFDTDAIEAAEALIGIDGVASYGWLPSLKKMKLTLQADSASNGIFEAVYTAQNAVREVFLMQGTIMLTSTGEVYNLVSGAMTSYSPMPAAKKVLQPRQYGITWQDITPSPISAALGVLS